MYEVKVDDKQMEINPLLIAHFLIDDTTKSKQNKASKLLTLMRQLQQKSSAFLVCWNVYKASMANSVDPDQTAPIGAVCYCSYRSSLFWVQTVCFYT